MILSIGVHAVDMIEQTRQRRLSERLLLAPVTGEDYEFLKACLEGGTSPDYTGVHSTATLLHIACNYGHEREVRLLLRYRASVNASGPLQETPVEFAASQVHKSREAARRMVDIIQKAGGKGSGEQ